jgi:hypothetical protein
VGSLLLFNPLSAQGSWKLHLDKRDDRMVADMIIQLKIKEKGHMLPYEFPILHQIHNQVTHFQNQCFTQERKQLSSA